MIATHHIVGPPKTGRLWECKFWRLLNLQIALHRRLNIVRWTLKSVNLITPLSFRWTSECVHINTYVHPSHTANKMCTATLIFQAKMAGRLCAHSFVFSANKRGCNYVKYTLVSAKIVWTSKTNADSVATTRRRRQHLQTMEARTFPRAGRCRKDAWCCCKCSCCHAHKLSEAFKLANINMRRKDSVDFVAWSYCCRNANNKMRKRCWKAQPNAKRNQTSGIIPEQPCGNARALARRNLQQHGKFHVACVKPTEPILVCGWKTSRGRANSGFPSFLATSNALGVTWWLDTNLIEQFNAS